MIIDFFYLHHHISCLMSFKSSLYGPGFLSVALYCWIVHCPCPMVEQYVLHRLVANSMSSDMFNF